MLAAMEEELRQRHGLISQRLETIYFGGGTPSILSAEDIRRFLRLIQGFYDIDPSVEITLEANPEDMHRDQITSWREVGINRLSVGIQTFNEERLKFLNRSHTAGQAIEALSLAKQIGFSNISGDLIYAVPPNDMAKWQFDVEQIIAQQLTHVSLYSLTIEEKTAFGNWKKRGLLQELNDTHNALQYEFAVQKLKEHGYEHYEVSNFAQPGYLSRHNSSYWRGKLYLGIGPGAHSYDGQARYLNIRHNAKYITRLKNGDPINEVEVLTPTQKLNEYLMTGLRTQFGIDLNHISAQYGLDLQSTFARYLDQLTTSQMATISNGHLRLTSKGMAHGDEITLKFFQEEGRIR